MQPMFPDGVLKKPMLDRCAVASPATTPAPARAASKTVASLTAAILTTTLLLRHDGDRLDLDLDLGPVERSDLDNRVGRVGRREPLLAQLDDLREVGGHIGEEDGHLDDALQAGAAGLEHAAEVAESTVGLSVEVADSDELSRLVDSDLAGDEQEVADPESLGEQVRRVGVRVDLDLLDLHLGLLWSGAGTL